MTADDEQLLELYSRERSEGAFSELVARHIDLVYSAALRKCGGDAHLAEDVTQSVFMDLARKAGGLPRDVVLAGWLHRHTCFIAANAVRSERRRRNREQTAMAMSALNDNAEPRWEHVAAQLDDGLNDLNADNRHAIVLRFLDRRDFRAIGGALGISEDAAQKRVSRALDKLREALSRRGVALPAAALASVLAAEAVTAAPAGLAMSVTAASMAAAATAGAGGGLAAIKLLATMKLQLAVAGAVLVAGMAIPLAVQHHTVSRLRANNERLQLASQAASEQAAAQVAALAAENRRLSNLVALASRPPNTAAAPTSQELQLRSEVTRLKKQALTNTSAKPGNAIAELFNNPGMKEMMRQQMANMVEREFPPLIVQMRLPSGQAAAFKNLLVQEMSAGVDQVSTSASADPAAAAQAAEAVKADKAAIEDQIHQLLGDNNFAQYQQYQKTLSPRLELTSFKDTLDGSGNALSADQERQLLQSMTEEEALAKKSALEIATENPPSSLTVDTIERTVSITGPGQPTDFGACHQLFVPGTI